LQNTPLSRRPTNSAQNRTMGDDTDPATRSKPRLHEEISQGDWFQKTRSLITQLLLTP
jgi:hypothetical protein